jgi:hypothetical protein
MASTIISSVDEVIAGISNLEVSPEVTILKFFSEGNWSYNGETTLRASFGKFRDLTRVGRVKQLNDIWKQILQSNSVESGKSEVLYFHGSPGLGKTYLLRELFSKKVGDYPHELEAEVKALKILVLDFNRSACIEAKVFKDDLNEHANLFALSRLFYVTFAKQDILAWDSFLRAVIALIRKGYSDTLTTLMRDRIKAMTKNIRCVILVDEIMKTLEIGRTFSEQVRSSVCRWIDDGICNVVLFSSLDATFITSEVTASGRVVTAVTTLPLLERLHSITLLETNIKVNFVDDGGCEVDREVVFNQLALISGGHPRSLEYIIDECNKYRDSILKISLMEVMKAAATKLCSACADTKDWRRLFVYIMLAREVKKDAIVGSDDNSETFKALVTRGVLIDSFQDGSDSFIPTVPELFLHKWLLKAGNDCLGSDERRFLDEILRLRSCFTAIKFEVFHLSWEKLMRYVRQSEPEYSRIPLNELYCNTLRDNATVAASCPVDGRSILNEIRYISNARITLEPNIVYNPQSAENPGWDRLLTMEAFPLAEKSRSRKKFIIPVFIQNKFSEDYAKTTLSITDVMKSHKHCMKFLEERVTLADGFHFLSRKGKWFSNKSQPSESDFILLLVAKREFNTNTIPGSPSNVLFRSIVELGKMYGPALTGFLHSMRQGVSVSVVSESL